MFKSANTIDFAKLFPDNQACLRFLADKKWKNGYHCVRCGCSQYVKGKTSFHRRCQRCFYDESVTANTLFHDMRLPLMKAFYLLFRITTKKKALSTIELGAEVGVQQKTAWLFKRKIQVAMLGINGETLSLEDLIMAGALPARSLRTSNKKSGPTTVVRPTRPTTIKPPKKKTVARQKVLESLN